MSEQISVTLSEENIAWLDANYNNRSAYIDDLLTSAREGTGKVDDAIRRYQIQQLESDISGMESELETKKQRLESLQKEHEHEQREKEILLEDAEDALDGAHMTPDNPAVRNWADKLDMTPEELIEVLSDD